MKSRRVSAALAAVGAQLKRAKNHLVYELPNGRTLVFSQTPSDYRAEEKMLRDIRHATGTVSQPKPSEPRQERRRKPGRSEPARWPALSPLANALQQSGVAQQATEQKLRWEILTLNEDLRDAQKRADVAEAALSTLRNRWFVKLADWMEK